MLNACSNAPLECSEWKICHRYEVRLVTSDLAKGLCTEHHSALSTSWPPLGSTWSLYHCKCLIELYSSVLTSSNLNLSTSDVGSPSSTSKIDDFQWNYKVIPIQHGVATSSATLERRPDTAIGPWQPIIWIPSRQHRSCGVPGRANTTFKISLHCRTSSWLKEWTHTRSRYCGIQKCKIRIHS